MTTTETLTRWVMEGYYGGRRYNWPQCRYCGHGGTDCRPAVCLLCGTRQCSSSSTCKVCHVGWLPGWSRGGTAEGKQCGYKGCELDAVANVARVKRACLEHTTRARVGRLSLPDYVAEQLKVRDAGKWWQHWRCVDELT
jgi:hypothetical protein